jgi:hypothetical protein
MLPLSSNSVQWLGAVPHVASRVEAWAAAGRLPIHPQQHHPSLPPTAYGVIVKVFLLTKAFLAHSANFFRQEKSLRDHVAARETGWAR